jgi:hypothetical protein
MKLKQKWLSVIVEDTIGLGGQVWNMLLNKLAIRMLKTIRLNTPISLLDWPTPETGIARMIVTTGVWEIDNATLAFNNFQVLSLNIVGITVVSYDETRE